MELMYLSLTDNLCHKLESHIFYSPVLDIIHRVSVHLNVAVYQENNENLPNGIVLITTFDTHLSCCGRARPLSDSL